MVRGGGWMVHAGGWFVQVDSSLMMYGGLGEGDNESDDDRMKSNKC